MLINIENYDDRVCILHCEGRFVAGPEMDYMHSKMDDINKLACPKVLADFQNVTSIGSMGVTFVVAVYTSVMRRPGGNFVLAGVSPHVRHVLDLTNLTSVIPLTSDLASGLAVLLAEAAMDSMAVQQ